MQQAIISSFNISTCLFLCGFLYTMAMPEGAFDPLSFRRSVVELLDSSGREDGGFDRFENFVRSASQRFPSSSRLKCFLGDVIALRSPHVPNSIEVRQEAEAVYAEALELDPFDPEPYRSLAGLFSLRGEVHKAEEYLEKALACEESFGVYIGILQLFVDHEIWSKASEALEDAAFYLEVQEAKISAARSKIP